MVSAGRYEFSRHAQQRMVERSATPRDVLRAIATATRARCQPDNDRWSVQGGVDLVGDDLTVIVKVEALVVIVTLF